jgi:tetratricopeptide (TPR) repeat protein
MPTVKTLLGLPGIFLGVFSVIAFSVPVAEQTISGTVLPEGGELGCDHCMITLLAVGGRPVATAYLDGGGHFSFPGVPAGSYTIHAQIEGFEEINQQVDANESFGAGSNVMITLARRNAHAAPVNSGIVNVSEFLDAYPKKAVAAFKKGEEYEKQKKDEQAMKSFESAIKIAPEFYQAHNELGILYKRAGRVDDAETEFIKAHELNRTNIEPLLNLTSLYIDENKPERAVNASEEAVKANSRSAPAFLNLGIALYKAAQLDKAEAALKRALELAPKMATVRLMLANVYLKLHQYDNVMEQLNTYIAENPHGEQLQAATQMRDQLLTAKQAQRP